MKRNLKRKKIDTQQQQQQHLKTNYSDKSLLAAQGSRFDIYKYCEYTLTPIDINFVFFSSLHSQNNQ